MKKTGLLIIVLLCIIAAFLITINNSFTGFITNSENIENNFDYTWTKAICEGNKCRDFEIKCLNGEILEMRPITSLVVFDKSWIDKRSKLEKEKLC